MIDATKIPVSLITFSVSCLLLASEVQAKSENERIQSYAGPQAVSPEDVIHVTVELADIHGNSLHNKTVYLSYIADGLPQKLEGIVQNGLVSFDVIAQKTAGRMDFFAEAEGLTSNAAPVIIKAAEPVGFSLSARPSRASDRVEITSETIVDAFDNPIADQNLVSLSWLDSGGVMGTEKTQLTNSRINLSRSCPVKFTAPLRLRAVLKNTEVLSSDMSTLCAAGKV